MSTLASLGIGQSTAVGLNELTDGNPDRRPDGSGERVADHDPFGMPICPRVEIPSFGEADCIRVDEFQIGVWLGEGGRDLADDEE